MFLLAMKHFKFISQKIKDEWNKQRRNIFLLWDNEKYASFIIKTAHLQ